MMHDDFEVIHRNRELYATATAPPGWLIVRVDGRGFSALTEAHFTKPFDHKFHLMMARTAVELMADLGGCIAYVQSDEISVALEPDWHEFNRRAEKVATVAAGVASAAFTYISGHRAVFDARIVAEPGPWAVAQYFLWRRGDAVRNALNSCLYWTLRNEGQSRRAAGRTLESLNRDGKIAALTDRGIDFHTLDPWAREGVFLTWEERPHEGWNPITQQTVATTRRQVATTSLRRVIQILNDGKDQ